MVSENKAENKRLIGRLLKRIFPYKWFIVLSFFLMLSVSILNIGNIIALKPVIEVLFASQEEVDKYIEKANQKDTSSEIEQENHKKEKVKALEKNAFLKPIVEKYTAFRQNIDKKYDGLKIKLLQNRKKAIVILSLIIIVVSTFVFIFSVLSVFIASYVGLSVVKGLKEDLYKHILNLDMKFFGKKATGYLMTRIANDVDSLQKMVVLAFGKVLQAPINLFFLFIFIIILNPQLTLINFCFIVLAAIPTIIFGKRVRKVSRKIRDKVSDMNEIMQETLSGIQVVKGFGMEDYEMNRFQEKNTKFFKYSLRRRFIRSLSDPFMTYLGAFAVVIIMLLATRFIIDQNVMSGSDFFVYLFALLNMYAPIRKLTKANQDLQEGLAGAERIFEILDTKPYISEAPNPVIFSGLKKEILFDNVSFSYNGEKEVIKDVSFNAKLGEVTAIVGPSGGGKSTITYLLLRFYDPQKGKIEIDGLDLKNVSFNSLREQIGLVTQESVLFNDSVRNNISYGQRKYSEEDIIRAATLANAQEFITQLPNGYDTVIGERGLLLSGGQKQRIAIARAVLKNPSILILDEATSNLDSESEALIQKAIDGLIKDRTTIVIAHRLSTVTNADQILVLNEGKIIERGKHKELIDNNGFYKKLCEIQIV